MPSRRDPDKTDATPTPFAALAPEMPARPAAKTEPTDATDAAEAMPPLPAAPAADAANDAIDVIGAVDAPDDVPVSERRSRAGARKVIPAAERAVNRPPAVPRTIAAMTAMQDDAANPAAPAASDYGPEIIADEPRPELHIPLRSLVLNAVAMYAIVGWVPSVVLVVAQRAGFSDTVSTATYAVSFLAVGMLGLAMLPLAWRAAFHEPAYDLRLSSLRDLWERRQAGFYRSGRPRRNGWVTASFYIIAGAVFLVGVAAFSVVAARGVAALYLVPFAFLLPILGRVVSAAILVGYLQRGLEARVLPVRAALITGVLLGAGTIIANLILLLVPDVAPAGDATVRATNLSNILIICLIALIVGLLSAWIRWRSRSVYAAVGFRIILFVLQFPV